MVKIIIYHTFSLFNYNNINKLYFTVLGVLGVIVKMMFIHEYFFIKKNSNYTISPITPITTRCIYYTYIKSISIADYHDHHIFLSVQDN